MIPALKALIVDYQMYYGLETIKEARKYIRKDLLYLAEQERHDYNIIRKGSKDNLADQSIAVQ